MRRLFSKVALRRTPSVGSVSQKATRATKPSPTLLRKNLQPPKVAPQFKPSVASSPPFPLHDFLGSRFGMSKFHPGQEQVIRALLSGENALAIFPTGGGKSLCYQLPSLMLPDDELTLVVSPLIALMKDQVDSLRAKNIAADMLGSGITQYENFAVRSRIRRKETRILFIAPEQVNNEGTKYLIQSRKIGLLAIDEAHCISEWGHAFRPDYLRLAALAVEVNARRVLCLTATATPQVAADICKSFKIQPANLVRTSFHRPNLKLHFEVVSVDERDALLLSFLRQKTTGPSIVYATQQETTETIARFLQEGGIPAKAYHAGMETDERNHIQDWFMGSNDAVVVATIAFGMGVDKSNIRRVVHYNLPKSLEGYAQEIGRAGRDGLNSDCLLYFCHEDLQILESFASCESPSARSIKNVLCDFFDGDGKNGFVKEVGAVREVSLSGIGRPHDMKESAVRMLVAFLDIYHNLVETLTPKIANFKLQSATGQPLDSIKDNILSSLSPDIGTALCSGLQLKRSWAFLDMDAVLDRSPSLTRAMLVEAINKVESRGQAKTCASRRSSVLQT